MATEEDSPSQKAKTPLTVEEIKAILYREEVTESTGVLTPDWDKMRLCRQLLEVLGEDV